jgi:hypothetical protein
MKRNVLGSISKMGEKERKDYLGRRKVRWRWEGGWNRMIFWHECRGVSGVGDNRVSVILCA